MLVDDSRAPFVFLRPEVETGLSIEEQFQRLLDKGQPFVLMTDHSPDAHHDESVEERREKALFFKKVKDRLRSQCRGMIVIERGKPTSGPARLMAATASKVFGFAVAFASDENEAIRQGEALLAREE